jgi:hypothetical protein
MHLIIYFCGTGDGGSGFIDGYGYTEDKANISTIFVQGCEHPDVCNGGLFPDLNAFAKRFVKNLFMQTDKGFSLTATSPETLEKLSIGIAGNHSKTKNADEAIESITLCGYSRGAVTCFEVAKQLNNIAPKIPVDIVANQPVPGNCYQGLGTNAASVADCSHLKNLRNVSVILGAYTGSILNYFTKQEKTNPIHRGFFSQIVPKLPRSAKRDLIVIPRESHHQDRENAPSGAEHMHLQIATYLQKKHLKLIKEDAVGRQRIKASAMYSSCDSLGPTLFPQIKQLQGIFGLNTKEVYRYVDKLHPTAGFRKEMLLGRHETLISWWNKHEKKASYFSTDLTKNLVKILKDTDKNDSKSLTNLFLEADKWLLLKEGVRTSRYYQVEALRNNIYHKLIAIKPGSKLELDKINRQSIYDTQHFLTKWRIASGNASYFKTDATRTLDKAFEVHANKSPTEENDRSLIASLDIWLEEKKDTNSSRYDLVLSMREHIENVVNSCYVSETGHQPSMG